MTGPNAMQTGGFVRVGCSRVRHPPSCERFPAYDYKHLSHPHYATCLATDNRTYPQSPLSEQIPGSPCTTHLVPMAVCTQVMSISKGISSTHMTASQRSTFPSTAIDVAIAVPWIISPGKKVGRSNAGHAQGNADPGRRCAVPSRRGRRGR